MSNRTSQANNAISQAWKHEYELVSKGKGTRNWTIEQQKDILEKGRAYDEDGRAFEGQHMQSVEAFPEYQSDPGNIQFLTRKEHLAARNGDWKNPTNWYYDPVTKEKYDFGSCKFEPCQVIELSTAISFKRCQESNFIIDEKNKTESKKTESNSSQTKQATHSHVTTHIVKSSTVSIPSPLEIKNSVFATGKSIGKVIVKGIAKGGKAVGYLIKGVEDFVIEHPETIEIIKDVLIDVIGIATTQSNRRSKNYTKSTDSRHNKNDSFDKPTNNSYPNERSSPIQHTVSGHSQRYNTKNGVVRKEKGPYTRGGNKK